MRALTQFLIAGALLFLMPLPLAAQYLSDTSKKKVSIENHNVRKATIRSAVLPGWGQAYNKKYWKIPIIYAALGTTGYLFYRNLNQYRDSREAYILATDNDPSNDNLIVEPYYSVRTQPQRIKDFRDAVRQNMDYCALWFIIIWGLNVADATVDAHLKTFDVSEDLSLRLKAGYSPLAGTSGISIVLKLGK